MDPSLLLPTASLDEAVQSFLSKVHEANPKIPGELIEKAFRYSWNAHKEQVRKSGEPYLAHPVAVSLILAEQKLDSVTIAAGLLHDVLEDTVLSRESLVEVFGEELASLVDGVTKIRAFNTETRQERQAETYRKMLLSMAKDLRVIIIKFADRLHNLRTLKYLEPDSSINIGSYSGTTTSDGDCNGSGYTGCSRQLVHFTPGGRRTNGAFCRRDRTGIPMAIRVWRTVFEVQA